jgi:hypothetical protein
VAVRFSDGGSQSARREPPAWAGNWQTLSRTVASRVHPFCWSQSGVRTHNAEVIDYSDCTGKPTTLTTGPPKPPLQ